jgi:hypothetical protein
LEKAISFAGLSRCICGESDDCDTPFVLEKVDNFKHLGKVFRHFLLSSSVLDSDSIDLDRIY